MCGIRPDLVCSHRLTGRECDVLIGIMAGDSSKDSARHLNISPRTIETHRGHVKKKFDVKNSADLVRVMLTTGCPPLRPKSPFRNPPPRRSRAALLAVSRFQSPAFSDFLSFRKTDTDGPQWVSKRPLSQSIAGSISQMPADRLNSSIGEFGLLATALTSAGRVNLGVHPSRVSS